MNYYRKPVGDMMLTFAIFAIVGTAAVSGGIALSQFNMVKSKLISSMESCQAVVINGIKDNLSDSALINDPAGSQTVLNGLRTNCITAAVASLGPDFQQYLIDRGNVLNDIYDNPNTIVQVNGQRIDIQVGVEASLANGFPVNFTRRSKPLNVIPSDLQLIDSTSNIIECTGGCGECGLCNNATGQCTPNFQVLDAGGQTGLGPYKEPRDDPEADGTYLCKDYIDTLAGQFCLANGGSVIIEGGLNGCDYGNGCKYIPNYHAWNQVGDFLTGTITLHWDGTVLSNTIPVVDTTYNHAATSMDYDRHDINPLLHQPFGVNADSPGDPAYAVCEQAAVVDDKTRIFITQQTFTANLYQEANNLGLGPFAIGVDPPHDPANALCNFAASQGGRAGSWQALLRYYAGSPHMATIIPFHEAVYLLDDTLVAAAWQFWSGNPHLNNINMDQYGNTIPAVQAWNVWTGFTNTAGWESTGSKFVSPPNQWMNINSTNCNNWTTNNGNPVGTGQASGVGTGAHPSHASYNNNNIILWAQSLGVVPCNQQLHLYCTQYNGVPLP